MPTSPKTDKNDMDVIELSEKNTMEREQAAQLLHKLADSLARHNSVNFERNGMKLYIEVPKTVTVEVEVEIESDEYTQVVFFDHITRRKHWMHYNTYKLL